MIRQLVEQDKVLCTYNTLSTPTNTAIHKYMNQKKVPMLFVATGASSGASQGVSLDHGLSARLPH